ncbi:hypothetical protein J1605_016226 [Eschrichtius robustus]|uniref:Aminopeptidase n=1 Tax=Eschrichtius robustus TaxID=9764 RepID=A0AB34G895_ESCRO|nr:hypothetical protein J1605_016226 [Eschrichtius robustus]
MKTVYQPVGTAAAETWKERSGEGNVGWVRKLMLKKSENLPKIIQRIDLVFHSAVMANSRRKLIFNIYIGFYCSAVIQICICSQFTSSSIDQFNKDRGAFPVATNGEIFPWPELRLPTMVIPLHYDLFVHPNLTSLDFVASEKIEVLVRGATQFIILHSKDLEIMNATLQSEEDLRYRKPGKKLTVLSYPAHEQIALLVPEKLMADLRYSVAIDFQAKLADGFEGFYKSTYRTLGGETRTIAVTDFEPTQARMAFPCFDEPLFKANFSIKIRRESRHIALSNMPKVKTIELEGGLLEDHFETTVKMSTYLVAYIVCDFNSVSGTASSGVKVSIHAAPDKWSQTHYALEASLKLLDFYENYFDIHYPLAKLDLVAIPDFESGAMENWGLVTCRETSLLFDPKTSSTSDKLWVTEVIAHELAHQWFGNLVTTEWWNDIWLNEGFATYMELISVNVTYPELQFGACILNMLKDFLSEEKFKKGIIHYLKKFSYRNAKNDDLWSSLSNDCLESDSASGGFCYSDSKTTSSTNLSSAAEGHTLDLPEKTSWVKFNVDSNGYYIVHYEGHGWDQLITLLNQNHALLRPKDRISLIHDAFQLVSAGRLTLGKALDLTRYLQHETSIPALLKGLEYLELFYHIMERRNVSDVTENLKHYLLQYFKPAIDMQSWHDEGSVWDRRLRSALLKLACYLNHAPCIQKATELFSQLIELGMEGKVIKTQDLAALLHAIARNPKGQQLAWNFVKENWIHLLKKFELGSFPIRMIISGTTSHFSSKDELQEVCDSLLLIILK